jgi:DnaJ-class molecular chaperone
VQDDQDLYDVLGVPRDASQSEIRARYKMLSTKLHPDKNPDPGAAKLFAEVCKVRR